MTHSTDRIEKHTVLRAPIARVWHALSDPRAFGAWFGFDIEGDFVVGRAVRGRFTGQLDADAIRAAQVAMGLAPSDIRMPPDDAVLFTVVEMVENARFVFRWIPYGIDAECDLANEPTTLVEISIAPCPEGTALTVVESGFDRVPAHRRERALRMNEGGWAAQCENVRRYVEGA